VTDQVDEHIRMDLFANRLVQGANLVIDSQSFSGIMETGAITVEIRYDDRPGTQAGQCPRISKSSDQSVDEYNRVHGLECYVLAASNVFRK
jgi:hypothetical protein